ncbi:dethiobiotin synthase [Oscillibacter sp.]|uniref:dethiobiotin synthase n=1 Tax=Oscillibacter sp. TaxID=1945593 RepID=UPI0026351034|nr:dethiobiotin synthase [Oscillibacter sp.]MDD3346984.1 dethiobiotin synthase [Oscillibacter sp.]
MSKNLFVTGTGTDVGKTFVSGLIVKKLHEDGKKVAYFKAAMSGNVRCEDGTLLPGDAAAVKAVSGIKQPIESMCPYVYETAVSPHLASRLEGNPVRLPVVKAAFARLSKEYDYVVVEGSGGILCPLRFDGETLQLEDVIRELALPCVMVADAGLGTINDVALTAFYMKAKHIPLKGILFNHFHAGDRMEEDNLRMCEYLSGEQVLASVADGDHTLSISPDALEALFA